MNLYLLYLGNMRTWLYIYILFLFFMDIDVSIFLGHSSWACHLFSLLQFQIAHASFGDHFMEFYFVDGGNDIANFQSRSFSWWSACDLDQASTKDISLGSQSFMKLNATTRHICIRFCHKDRHMALVGQTRGVVNLWRFSF